MKRIAALVLSFGLITAAAASVNAASLLTTDQLLLKKPSQETGAQTLRDMMTWRRSNIQPQKP